LASVLPQTLRSIPLLTGLSEAEKDALLEGGHLRQYSRGQMIFGHGEPVTHFYVVVRGTVQLFRENSDGHEKTIDVLKDGQTMCESEIMDSCRSHRVNAVPVEDTTLLEFPVGWLKSTAQRHSNFALNLLSLIAAQAHMAEVEAEHQATMSAAQLVACFLQRLCVLYDFDPHGFELPYSKTLIASRLGMELETFSRAVAKLREHGIALKGTHVAIHDLSRIEQYACGFCSIAEDCTTHQAMERKVSKSGVA